MDRHVCRADGPGHARPVRWRAGAAGRLLGDRGRGQWRGHPGTGRHRRARPAGARAAGRHRHAGLRDRRRQHRPVRRLRGGRQQPELHHHRWRQRVQRVGPVPAADQHHQPEQAGARPRSGHRHLLRQQRPSVRGGGRRADAAHLRPRGHRGGPDRVARCCRSADRPQRRAGGDGRHARPGRFRRDRGGRCRGLRRGRQQRRLLCADGAHPGADRRVGDEHRRPGGPAHQHQQPGLHHAAGRRAGRQHDVRPGDDRGAEDPGVQRRLPRPHERDRRGLQARVRRPAELLQCAAGRRRRLHHLRRRLRGARQGRDRHLPGPAAPERRHERAVQQPAALCGSRLGLAGLRARLRPVRDRLHHRRLPRRDRHHARQRLPGRTCHGDGHHHLGQLHLALGRTARHQPPGQRRHAVPAHGRPVGPLRQRHAVRRHHQRVVQRRHQRRWLADHRALARRDRDLQRVGRAPHRGHRRQGQRLHLRRQAGQCRTRLRRRCGQRRLHGAGRCGGQPDPRWRRQGRIRQRRPQRPVLLGRRRQ